MLTSQVALAVEETYFWSKLVLDQLLATSDPSSFTDVHLPPSSHSLA